MIGVGGTNPGWICPSFPIYIRKQVEQASKQHPLQSAFLLRFLLVMVIPAVERQATCGPVFCLASAPSPPLPAPGAGVSTVYIVLPISVCHKAEIT